MKQSRTWKDVVVEALQQLGGEGSLKEIAAIAKLDPKASTNSKVTEKVRQVVRKYKVFTTDKEGSGIYRLTADVSLVPVVQEASKTKAITDEIQGKLLYIGRANNYETFAPADDCTKRNFAERPLGHFVSVRDISGHPRFRKDEIQTIARIDVLWLTEVDGDLLPRYAFEIENSTKVITGLNRLSMIPSWFPTRLFIVGKDDAQRTLYERHLRGPAFKPRADRFGFKYFEEIRALFSYAEAYYEARTANEEAMKAAGLYETA